MDLFYAGKNVCDCCLKHATQIVPYGDSQLCLPCWKQYLAELKKSPTIGLTNFNTAKRKLAALERNPFFRILLFFKGINPHGFKAART
jgi:hypothetical protein